MWTLARGTEQNPHLSSFSTVVIEALCPSRAGCVCHTFNNCVQSCSTNWERTHCGYSHRNPQLQVAQGAAKEWYNSTTIRGQLEMMMRCLYVQGRPPSSLCCRPICFLDCFDFFHVDQPGLPEADQRVVRTAITTSVIAIPLYGYTVHIMQTAAGNQHLRICIPRRAVEIYHSRVNG